MSEPSPEPMRARSIEIEIPEGHTGIVSIPKEGKSRIEDAFSRIFKRGRFGVFDGLGKIPGAAEAAQAAKDSVENLTKRTQPATSEQDATSQMYQLLQLTNKIVQDTETCGQTTGTLVQFIEVDKQKQVIVGSVGDSRAYLIDTVFDTPPERQLTQLTIDNKWIDEALPLQQARELSNKLDSIQESQEFSPHPIAFKTPIPDFPIWKEEEGGFVNEYRTEATEEEFFNLRSQLLKTLGAPEKPSNPFNRDITVSNVKKGDLVLITSDGIHDNLTPDEIRFITRRYSDSPQKAADELVKLAKKRSKSSGIRSKPDDMTALVIKVP